MQKKRVRYSDPFQRNLPNSEGVYRVKGIWGLEEWQEIDVYLYRPKGICCFSEDFGSGGTGVDDRHDCHVSVQFTGLIWGKRYENCHQGESGLG